MQCHCHSGQLLVVHLGCNNAKTGMHGQGLAIEHYTISPLSKYRFTSRKWREGLERAALWRPFELPCRGLHRDRMALDVLQQYENYSCVLQKALLLQLLMSGVFLRGLVFESQSAAMCNSSAQLAPTPRSALRGFCQSQRDVQHLLQDRDHITGASYVLLIEEPDRASPMHADGHWAAQD